MRRVEDNADEMVGQDSFLDVITNIVGILILLVMVMGLRSSKAAATAVGANSPTLQQQVTEDQLREALETTAIDEHDVRSLVRRAYETNNDTMLREQERQWLAEAVTEAEQQIEQRRAKLNASDQRDFDIRRKLTEAQLRLEELTREQIALLAHDDTDVEKIECEPTPIARLVRGKEVHVQLANDFVAIVPVEELKEMMVEDLNGNSWRLNQEETMTRTIGPLDGFRLQYRFEVDDYVGQGRTGIVSGKRAQFAWAFLLPITSPLGEPALDAMAPGSEFRKRIEQFNPSRTTITIWTYAGNYDRLRELKSVVRSLGYQTAIRPLPENCPIGFSPNGTRSVIE